MGRQAKEKAGRRGKKAVFKILRRDGVFDRVRELERTFYDPKFRARLNELMVAAAGTPDDPKDLQDVRDLAMKLAAEEFGVDTRDTMLTLDWQPDLGRKLFPEFHPSIEAVQRAQEEAAGRGQKPAPKAPSAAEASP